MSSPLFADYKKAYFLAQSLLTRIPIPQLNTINESDAGRSALFYPLVGLLIGLILYLPLLFFSQTSLLLSAALIVTLWAAITGGLHLDGLADSADGWLGGGVDKSAKQKTLEIIKDPLVGSAGVIVLECILLLKFAVLSAIFQQIFHGALSNAGIIIIAPIIGRAMILLMMLSSENANPNSMANQVVDNLPKTPAIWLTAISLLVAAYFSLSGVILSLVVFWLLRRLMYQRLGGFTGDTLGATVEICEVAYLIGAVLMVNHA
jgi:adenosylcobinamide-GDP ribazoletransferase